MIYGNLKKVKNNTSKRYNNQFNKNSIHNSLLHINQIIENHKLLHKCHNKEVSMLIISLYHLLLYQLQVTNTNFVHKLLCKSKMVHLFHLLIMNYKLPTQLLITNQSNQLLNSDKVKCFMLNQLIQHKMYHHQITHGNYMVNICQMLQLHYHLIIQQIQNYLIIQYYVQFIFNHYHQNNNIHQHQVKQFVFKTKSIMMDKLKKKLIIKSSHYQTN